MQALINLTSDNVAQREVGTDSAYLRWIVEAILSPNGILSDPFCMLLSNLSKLESVCAALHAIRLPAPPPLTSDGTTFSALIDAFVRGDGQALNKFATFHFLASVFANASVAPSGRMALLKGRQAEEAADRCPLARISAFTEHHDPIRRGGVASTIKNCCFVKEAHSDILSPERLNLLPRILLPLCGPEEFDLEDLDALPEECQLLPPEKRREPDRQIRLIHIESLLLLSSSAAGRAELRRRNVYRVVQLLHKSEKDSQVKEAVERLVQFLQRDDGDETKIEEVDDEDSSVQEV